MIVALAEDLALPAVLDRREAIIAVATREVSTAALHADWLVVGSAATIALGRENEAGERHDAHLVGALIWRMGSRARSLLLTGPRVLSAREAFDRGIVDAIVPAGSDALPWTIRWASFRSGLAFDAAALLLRSRGGDPLEQAVFAWLFSTGEPQEGLRAFLEKRPAEFHR